MHHLKTFNFVLLIFLINFFYFACMNVTDEGGTESTKFSIEGNVTDINDNVPLYYATVELEICKLFPPNELLERVKTNQDGHYELRYTVEGHCSTTICIRAHSNAYRSKTYYSVPCTENLQTFNFQLEKK